jgi:hypothetical protein
MWNAIGEAIAAHDHVMLLWSKTAAQSHFVEFEWNTAVALRKTILPCGHMATTSWLFVIFDTAGEVSASYAAALSAISLANGVIRVFAREVSKNHSPSRKTFSPTAVRMCPKHTRLRPL